MCAKNHDLEQCKAYLTKSVDERSKYLSTKKLCYGCLKSISKTHTARNCNQSRACKVCNEKHPTSLHGFKLKKKTNQGAVNDTPDQSGTSQDGVLKSSVTVCDENIACASTKFSAQVISMCVVPVLIKHKDSTKEIITHAILDSCSQGTFIVEDLVNALEIDGIDTSVVVKTLNGQSRLKSKLVNGLAVSNPFEKKFWINLPRCYTRKELPVDPEEIPTPEKLRRWHYLQTIASETVQNPSVHVGVLIGANCLPALEPTEFIRSEAGGPYAYKTKLGWCIVGPIAQGNSGKETITCNRIVVKDINSSNLANHHFQIKTEVKDVGIEEMFKKMYNQDFCEDKLVTLGQSVKQSCDSVISWEDKRFLNLMNRATRMVSGHYELPLPFKNDDTILPNNRYQALQRLTHLKNKFQRNLTFCSHYKEFMNTLMRNGYAKKSTDSATEGKCWYIPQHGVYNENKPNKIRVVFDCSTEYQGRSLNNELMSGPDLTNQIIGVLIRFRQEPIAIMADIESMFYQVRVPGKHQNFLRFLWWENNNLDCEPSDHQMCVHVFGGTSSPSCCNFALKQTSTDNVEEFGSATAQTLQRNFYVDDMLKP